MDAIVKLELIEATMVAGEWQLPGYVFEAPGPLAENFIRSGVAQPAEQYHKASECPNLPPAGDVGGLAEKAVDKKHDRGERAVDKKHG